MATNIEMPQMGESIYEGTITKWLKNVGDRVERDEAFYELSTDKVDTEIPSPVAGIVTEIKVLEGEKAPIHTVVAVVEENVAVAPAKREVAKVAAAASAPKPEADPVPAPTKEDGGEKLLSSPLVRRMPRFGTPTRSPSRPP